MKRFYQTLFICLVIPLWTHAQDANNPSDSGRFTLERCIQYALENTMDMKNARIDEKISEAKVKETRGIGLPQIDGSVSVLHNRKLPRFFGPYSSDTTQISFFPEVEGVEDGDVLAAANFFQLPNSGDAKVTINQLIFNSSYLVGLKAAATYKELAQRSTKLTEIEVIENVTKAYYGVLVNNERIALFDANIGRVDSLLRTTRALNKNGFAEEIDVDRVQVTLNNLKSERLKFQNMQSLSLNLLKFQMNYPMEKPLSVDGDLKALSGNANLFNEYNDGWDYTNRAEWQLLETQQKLQELDIKNQYSHSMPSLVAFANLGYSTQSQSFGGLFKTETNFGGNEFIGPDKWYSYSNFGLSLQIPLFSGLQRNYQIQQSKLSLLKVKNEKANLKQAIDFSIQQNTTTYQNALESLNSQRENLTLAQKVARITKIKYEQGVGSNIEVIDAESSLRESQVNYYNALFDAIISRIDLDKAYGKINMTRYTTPGQQ